MGGGRKGRKEGEWASPFKDSDLWGEVKFRDDQKTRGMAIEELSVINELLRMPYKFFLSHAVT